MAFANVGDEVCRPMTLSASEISAFAHSCGDENPLHHDPARAAASRFGGVIASGPHYAALYMGAIASHYSARASMLGLEFSFAFRAPVHAERAYEIHWRVTEVVWKQSLRGEIVSLEGGIRDGAGAAVLVSSAKVLVSEQL